MYLSWWRDPWSATREPFLLNVFCNVEISIPEVIRLLNMTLDLIHRLKLSLAQLSRRLLQKVFVFSIVFHGSWPSEIPVFLHYVQNSGTKNKTLLRYGIHPFPFLWMSIICVFRSMLSTFRLAMLTPMLPEEECQRLQKSNLVTDIRAFQVSWEQAEQPRNFEVYNEVYYNNYQNNFHALKGNAERSMNKCENVPYELLIN